MKKQLTQEELVRQTMKVKSGIKAGTFAASEKYASIILQDGTHGCDVC